MSFRSVVAASLLFPIALAAQSSARSEYGGIGD